MSSYYIKTNKIFTPLRKYAWLFIFLVAFGGLWFPKLGLLIIPVMLTLGILGFFKGLVHGVRYEEDFIYDDYFKRYDEENSKFHYKQVVSRPRGNDYSKGYVTDIIKEMDLDGHKVYICGTKTMTGDTVQLLERMGVKEENIYSEAV